MNPPKSTIFALATPPGKSALAVMRVSGERAGDILSRLSRGHSFEPRLAALCALYQPEEVEPFDRGLVLWFAGPASYTGENAFELHLHGGTAVVEAASRALLALGAEPAGPGEFTRRAFENGKLDLVQAEAVADLIDARTEAQRQQAQRQLSGALGSLYEGWHQQLDSIRALLEAGIDFPDEDDVLETVLTDAARLTRELMAIMQTHLHDRHRGERIREGLRIALIGPVNAGKSTLLNYLAGEEAAIVSEEPGTTRDIIRVSLDMGGYLVELADSAGVRDAQNPVEKEGVSRARALAENADIRLFVVEAQSMEALDKTVFALAKPDDFLLFNKSDLLTGPVTAPAGPPTFSGTALMISARDGLGMGALLEALKNKVSALLGAIDAPSLTRARHRLALKDCVRALDRALAPLPGHPELAAEELREAGAALGKITGESGTEDILERIFNSFCIGK